MAHVVSCSLAFLRVSTDESPVKVVKCKMSLTRGRLSLFGPRETRPRQNTGKRGKNTEATTESQNHETTSQE